MTATLRTGTGLGKETSGPILGVAMKAEDVSWDVSGGRELREGCGSVSRCGERKERGGSTFLVPSRAAHPTWGSGERKGGEAEPQSLLPSHAGIHAKKSSAKV